MPFYFLHINIIIHTLRTILNKLKPYKKKYCSINMARFHGFVNLYWPLRRSYKNAKLCATQQSQFSTSLQMAHQLPLVTFSGSSLHDFYEEDVKRVRDDDRWLSCFLKSRKQEVNDALPALVRTQRYQSMKINH